MKAKRWSLLICIVTVAVMAASVVSLVLLNRRGDGTTPTTAPADRVTVTFDTDGGSSVAPVVLNVGQTLTELPFTDKIGYCFLGWYYDRNSGEQFFIGDEITGDLTLYAVYEKMEAEAVLPEYTEVSLDTDRTDYALSLYSPYALTEENLFDYVTFTGRYGALPNFRVLDRGENIYEILPVGGYKNGGVYAVALSDESLRFVGLDIASNDERMTDEQIRTLYLAVNTGDEETVRKTDSLFALSAEQYTLLETEEETYFLISQKTYADYPFDRGAVIELAGDGLRYVKAVGMTLMPDGTVAVQFEDCDLSDVYQNVELHQSDITPVNALLEDEAETQRRLRRMVNALYESEGTRELTAMLVAALESSSSVRALGDGTSPFGLSSDNSAYADRITDKKGFNIAVDGLLEGLKITASIGTAKNPNFNGSALPKYNDDAWTMLSIRFEYEGTLKNKVKIEATIEISEYFYIWMTSSANNAGDFNVEVTPLSQTDLSFTVLVCSTDGEEKDDKKEDGKEEKKDISVEIRNLTEGNGDASNLIKDVQDMLENKGDAIELCKAPLCQVSYVVGGVLSINFDVNFVIKVSFAAGVRIEASVLEATTIGITGNLRDKHVETYRRAAKGSDRYIFDFYAYGYLGVKAGIEGELTVSFTGLKKLLRAGVSLEVGAYADLYGYLHYHAEERRIYKDIDTNNRHFQTLEGGVYFEMGIYIELKVFVGVGQKEYGTGKEFKFKLLEAGNQYLYIGAAENQELKLVFRENKDNELDLDGIIPAEGEFLNIKTGETETRTLPLGSIRLVSESNYYRVDNQKHKLTANLEKIDQHVDKGILSGKIALYYKGQNILFSSKSLGENSEALKGYKQLATVVVYYVRDGVSVDEEQLGREVTLRWCVRYPTESGYTTETVRSYTVTAGGYVSGNIPEELFTFCTGKGLLRDYSSGRSDCYIDTELQGRYCLTEDKTITLVTHPAQRFIAVRYKDFEGGDTMDDDLWTVEIRAMNYLTNPTIDPKYLTAPDTTTYVSLCVITPDGVSVSMTANEELSRYDLYMTGVSGFPTDRPLVTFRCRGDEAESEVLARLGESGAFGEYTDLTNLRDYYTYMLSAEYQHGRYTVTFFDGYGGHITHVVDYESVCSAPSYLITNIAQRADSRLSGWDTDGDGIVDLLPDEEFVVTSDMVLRPVLVANGYSLTYTDIDGNTETLTLAAGADLPQAMLDLLNRAPQSDDTAPEGSYYTDPYWRIRPSDFVTGDERNAYFANIAMYYHGDLTKMPACDLVFTAVPGKLYHRVTLRDETGGHYERLDEETGDYVNIGNELVLNVRDGGCVGDAEEMNGVRYVPPRDTETLQYVFYRYLGEDGGTLSLYSTKITAPASYHVDWWKLTENTYSLSFEVNLFNEYGNLLETETLCSYTGLTKDRYEALVTEMNAEYERLTGEAYRDSLSDRLYVYEKYADGILDLNLESAPDFKGITRRYYSVNIIRKPRMHTVTVDFCGGNYSVPPEQYRAGSLFVCYTGVTRAPDKYNTYTFAGYDADGDGQVDYLPGEAFEVTSDVTLRAVWTEEKIVYTIVFYVPGGRFVLDGQDKGSTYSITGYYGDEIDPAKIPQAIFDDFTFTGWDRDLPAYFGEGDNWEPGYFCYVTALGN